MNEQLDTLAQWSRTGTRNREVYSGSEFKFKRVTSFHGIKWQKKLSGIWKKGQDEGIEREKLGRKPSNGVGDVGKEEREGGREK